MKDAFTNHKVVTKSIRSANDTCIRTLVMHEIKTPDNIPWFIPVFYPQDKSF